MNFTNIESMNTSSTRPTSGAMALFDKYAGLSKSIEETRKKNAQLQTELESIHQNIQRTKEEQEKMKEETKHEQSEYARFQKQTKEIKVHMMEIARTKKQAKQMEQSSKDRLQSAKSAVKQERIDFLKKCSEFRKSCERMRISAAEVLPAKLTNRYYNLQFSQSDCSCSEEEQDGTSFPLADEKYNGAPTSICEPISCEDSTISSLNDDCFPLAHDAVFTETPEFSSIQDKLLKRNKDACSIDDSTAIPYVQNYQIMSRMKRRRRKCKQSADDTELTQANEKYKDSEDAQKQAKRGLEDAKQDHRQASKRAEERIKKLEQQRKQLERVTQDVEALEQQIAQTKEETVAMKRVETSSYAENGT